MTQYEYLVFMRPVSAMSTIQPDINSVGLEGYRIARFKLYDDPGHGPSWLAVLEKSTEVKE